MPPMIPAVGSPLFPPDSVPLGSNSIEREPVAGVVGAIEAILRQPRRVMYQLKQPGAGGLIVSLLLVIGSFVVLAKFSGAPPNSAYVPAHIENGKFVPGTTK